MRLPLRRIVFWLHLMAAVAVGLVVLAMAGTGILLAFEPQILSAADRDSRLIAPPPGSVEPAPIEILLATIAAQQPSLAATSVTLKRDPREATVLALGREGVVYVDPYRRVRTGAGSTAARDFLRKTTELHRYLGGADERRALGKSVTGAANLVFLFILASGLYLWVPRILDRTRLRNVVWFRRQLTPRSRDLNWHHVLGLWASVPLVLIVVSALPMSYEWADDVLMRATRSPLPERSESRPGTPRRAAGPAAASAVAIASLDLHGLDRVVERAMTEAPGWRSITVRLPPSDAKVAVTVDGAVRRGRPDLRTSFVVDRETGRVLERERFSDLSAGRRARSWMRWVHTGEAGGMPGQIVAALACAATLVLGWTGFALALRRLNGWRRRVAVSLPLHPEGLGGKVDA
jgi:uncharacterized iron-regulated membrane protein